MLLSTCHITPFMICTGANDGLIILNMLINCFSGIQIGFIPYKLCALLTLAGAEYYMAMNGLLGDQADVAKLKLLLSDRTKQGSFCLTFDYRVLGNNVGTLRVLLDNNAYPVWEQSHSRSQGWQTELLTVAWKEEAPESVSHSFHQSEQVLMEHLFGLPKQQLLILYYIQSKGWTVQNYSIVSCLSSVINIHSHNLTSLN